MEKSNRLSRELETREIAERPKNGCLHNFYPIRFRNPGMHIAGSGSVL